MLGVFAPLLLLLGDSSFSRAASLGFFSLGAFLLVVGFAHGTRGSLRAVRADDARDGRLARGLRAATPGERRDAVTTALGFFGFGLVFVVLGVLLDDRTGLF